MLPIGNDVMSCMSLETSSSGDCAPSMLYLKASHVEPRIWGLPDMSPISMSFSDVFRVNLPVPSMRRTPSMYRLMSLP